MQRGAIDGSTAGKESIMNQVVSKQMSDDEKETLEWVECIPVKNACGEDVRFMREDRWICDEPVWRPVEALVRADSICSECMPEILKIVARVAPGPGPKTQDATVEATDR
jgi:hypothetical protein